MKTTEEMIHETVQKVAAKNKPEERAKMEKALHDILENGVNPKEAFGISQESVNELYDMACQHYNSGKYKNAFLICTHLTLMDPQVFNYRFGQAAALHKEKQFVEAIDAYVIAMTLDPMNPLPFYHISDCCLALKDPFRALYYIDMSLAQAKKNPEKYALLIQHGELARNGVLNQIKALPGMDKAEELMPLIDFCYKLEKEGKLKEKAL